MRKNIEKVIESIQMEDLGSVANALDQIEVAKKLTAEEKTDLAAALTAVFYVDHMNAAEVLVDRIEKQLIQFGSDILPLLLEELSDSDTESAKYLCRVIHGIGDESLDFLLEAWEKNQQDEFALMNLMLALSAFNSAKAVKAITKILSVTNSKNFHLRALSANSVKRLVTKLPANLVGQELKQQIFDALFPLMSDPKPLVRKNAVNALGKMLKKNMLDEPQKQHVFRTFDSILGNDDRHEWDPSFIVRKEVERFVSYCKISHIPDHPYDQSFRILSKKELCQDTMYFNVEVPLIAKKIQAGQFVIVRPNALGERIPLSVCGWDPKEGTIQLIVTAVGKTSSEINAMEVGDCFADIVGPLGNRSHVKKHDGACVVIGGGYGTGAIIPTARDLTNLGNRVLGIIGARTKDLLIMKDELKDVCEEVFLTTNDGSAGQEGMVTDALQKLIDKEKIAHVLAIGPMPMMQAVSKMTKQAQIETFVSLNAIIVDGTGMCGACRVTVGGKTRFACYHGPDFNGHEVDYEELMKRQKMFVASERIAVESMKN